MKQVSAKIHPGLITDWFPPTVKPINHGVYQVRIDYPGSMKGELVFQYWNGKFWGLYSFTVLGAGLDAGSKSFYQEGKWRGLKRKL